MLFLFGVGDGAEKYKTLFECGRQTLLFIIDLIQTARLSPQVARIKFLHTPYRLQDTD